jgi:hypothetical protein
MNIRNVIILVGLSLTLNSCITTLAPGIIYNSTAEHVYKDRATSQLGSGRILKMEQSCSYNSIVFAPFYHSKPSTVENIAREGKITRIGVVDYSSVSILGVLYYSNCVNVWGDME